MGEWALFGENPAGYVSNGADAEFDFDVRPFPYCEGAGNSPQDTIFVGASLWVLEDYDDAEYKGVCVLGRAIRPYFGSITLSFFALESQI